jgi:Xaa-Pro aminopeptidase
MISNLIIAEKKAKQLFDEAENRNYFSANQLESELNTKLYQLADELFNIKKYWHKRIVRSGANTLLPYQANPIDLVINENDILFIDFGPVFEEWEADFGRTYVIGKDAEKIKLKNDVEQAWYIGKQFFDEHYSTITCSQFFSFTKELAYKMGWQYGNHHCGHLIGNFPHELILGDEINNYFHADNHQPIATLDIYNQQRYWIYEIHFIDSKKQIGGFFEQLIS